MYAMDPDEVGAAGATLGALADRARTIALGLEQLVAPRGGGVSIAVPAAAFLQVWCDSTGALATELRLLDRLCMTCASSVVAENQAAQRRYVDAREPAPHPRRSA